MNKKNNLLLSLVCFFMIALFALFLDAKPVCAAQTVTARMFNNLHDRLEDQIESEVNYVAPAELRSVTLNGELCKGEVIILKVPVSGLVLFDYIGGYRLLNQHMALFSDSSLTNMIYDLDCMKDYFSYTAGKDVLVPLNKGTYYLFNGSSDSFYGQWDVAERTNDYYTVSIGCFITKTTALTENKIYCFGGKTGCAKITLTSSVNINLETHGMDNIKICDSNKNVLYTPKVDSTGCMDLKIYLKAGTYYITFTNLSKRSGIDLMYGVMSYRVMSWAACSLSDAKCWPTVKGMPVAFRYTATATGYLTFASPKNYDAVITQLNSSKKKIGRIDGTDGCSDEKACFVVEQGKTYYFVMQMPMVYCDSVLKVNYSLTKASTIWGTSRSAATQYVSGTTVGVWQYGQTSPMYARVRKTQNTMLYLNFKMNRFTKMKVQILDKSGNAVKFKDISGKLVTSTTISRTTEGWGTKTLSIDGKPGIYYVKLTPVDKYCAKFQLRLS